MPTVLRPWSWLIGLALVASSCGGDAGPGLPPGDSPPTASLDGTSWTVTGGTLDGVALLPVEGRVATLTVEDGRVTGSTGCNTYHGTISIKGATISFGGLAVTEIGCEPGLMDFETRMLAVLGRVDRFTGDADRLTLANGDGSATLDLVATVPKPDASLDAATWRLTGITRGDVASSLIAGTHPLLVFDLTAGSVRGNGGCNDFGAAVTLDGTRILLTDIASTTMECDDVVMDQEAEYFRILADTPTWQIDGTTLVITAGDGRALQFTSDQRPEDVAVAWVAAVAAGDLDTAAALMAPDSLANVGGRGGLDALSTELAEGSTELAEGWAAWDRVGDRKVWSVTGRFSSGIVGTAVVFVGTVQQEGMTERRAVSLVTVARDGIYLVHPFTRAGQVGFVVPRAEFIDRVTPDVPFELVIPEGFEANVFLDDTGPLPVATRSPIQGQVRVTAAADPLPQPGEHVLTVIHLTETGEVGAQAVSFATYP